MTPPARLTGKSCGTLLTKATLTTHIHTCITTQHYSDAPLSSERPPDAVDDDAGHGSHCSASIAGNCEYGSSTSMSKYNGLAYNAKVAFFDIGVTGTNELNPPLYLDSEMFLPMYNGMCMMISPAVVVEIQTNPSLNYPSIHLSIHPLQLQRARASFRTAGARPRTTAITSSPTPSTSSCTTIQMPSCFLPQADTPKLYNTHPLNTMPVKPLPVH